MKTKPPNSTGLLSSSGRSRNHGAGPGSGQSQSLWSFALAPRVTASMPTRGPLSVVERPGRRVSEPHAVFSGSLKGKERLFKPLVEVKARRSCEATLALEEHRGGSSQLLLPRQPPEGGRVWKWSPGPGRGGKAPRESTTGVGVT